MLNEHLAHLSFFPITLFKFFFSFIVVLGGDTLWHLQRFLQCINYIILEFIPPPIHGIVTIPL
jgi:hypothetical protein